eukprot:TRINITY_DN34375_c0_g1_i1.p1 TRINITY_DN34375_c0_g1~~TRINITY_DN34375_c0_g1_i1.p1  ORF type:complete len:344 (+),score=116.79 TRINITY_DN34375_c0_g1_i1:90-1034(+)
MEVKSPVAEENEAEIPADNASGQKAEETTAKSEPLPDVEKAEAAPLPTLSTMDFLNPPEESGCYGRVLKPYINKGSVSNFLTFTVMVAAIAIREYGDERGTFFAYVLAFGLFGFAGGITNWLAVKMLFDRVPLLYGSGVIPRQFKQIRQTVKDVLLATFFDPAFLEAYISSQSRTMLTTIDFNGKLQTLIASESFDKLLHENLVKLAESPEGLFLGMIGLTPDSLKPIIKPFIANSGADMVPLLINNFDPLAFVSVHKVREEVDNMMTVKLEELTPEIVKRLLEVVMREHLGWLIVWGNVFGGMIGLVSKFAGY